MIRTIVLLLLLSISEKVCSQVNQDWAAVYDHNFEADVSSAMVIDEEGNIYIAGQSGFPYDFVTIKYNLMGVQLWVARYAGSANNHDQAAAIALDKKGNVYVTGPSGHPSDILTIKYNSQGIEQWTATYNGPANYFDFAHSLGVDDDCNVYVGGNVTANGHGHDFATIKYDSNGFQQWAVIQGNNGFLVDRCLSFKVDGAGDILVSGFSTDSGNEADYLTIKYIGSGIKQWEVRYDGPGKLRDIPNSMDIDMFGNIYLTGASEGINTNEDYATIKYNSAGQQQWVARYNDPDSLDDTGSYVSVDNTGSVYVTGKSFIDSSYENCYTTIKYNSAGEEMWTSRYLMSGSNYLPALALDAFNNVYIAGNIWNPPNETDYITIKYNSFGIKQWEINYNGPNDSADYPAAIVTYTKSNVYVTGSENTFLFNNSNIATVKYSQIIVNVPTVIIAPDTHLLFQNYPNPFNPVTTINYQIQKSEFVKLAIYDVRGVEIETLVNKELQSGIYETNWDASNYSNGIYFYRLSAGEYREVRKMLYIK